MEILSEIFTYMGFKILFHQNKLFRLISCEFFEELSYDLYYTSIYALYFISTIVTITVTQINKALHIPLTHRHFTFPASVTKSLLLDPGKKFVSQYMKQFFFSW